MTTAEMARLLGRRGGRARSDRLSSTEKRRIASLGGQARAESLRIARDVIANFRYALAVRALSDGDRPIRVQKTFRGRLPGLYRDRA